MDFRTASKLGSLLSKDYAENFFRLLVMYKDISASEAASRLNLHTQTAQDFLEALGFHGIVSKKQVFEKKRPYFRYSLKETELIIKIDFSILYDKQNTDKKLNWQIREKKNSGAMFKTSSKGDHISAVCFFVGEGRTRNERRLSLTDNQGRFLFQLPFPTEPFLSVHTIVKKAKVDASCIPEILDIVGVLKRYQIIERVGGTI